MQMTVYNPQKGRLETIDAVFTDENTTWFENGLHDRDIYMITDFQGGLLITQHGCVYPTWIYDISRADIEYNQQNARRVMREIEAYYK